MKLIIAKALRTLSAILDRTARRLDPPPRIEVEPFDMPLTRAAKENAAMMAEYHRLVAADAAHREAVRQKTHLSLCS